jgi:5,5'-dehydrodivanillate O-demethylase oxygenase subunit
MLSTQENERLTRVDKGTDMGELLRRYWHPIAASVELLERPTKAVRLLGEDLVLYQDTTGRLGLIGRVCPHRGVSLVHGVPEADGLRCSYHGWKYNAEGQCIQQPYEEYINPNSRFKEKVCVVGYPVEELGGLVFAYLGPLPAPLLPRWGPLVWENSVRDIVFAELDCNWLQCQENSLDPVHSEWLHAYYGDWTRRRKAAAGSMADQGFPPMRHKKIGFDVFEHGIIKRRVLEGFTEEDEDWRIGHPVLFPNILLAGSTTRGIMQFRVPVDTEHTLHITLYTFRAAPGTRAPEQPVVPYRTAPLMDEQGEWIDDLLFNQDYMVWVSQGPVAARDQERLGESDIGVILFRRLLKQQMEIMLDGGEPMNTFRDPEVNAIIEPPLEHAKFGGASASRYVPTESGISKAADDINAVLATWNQTADEHAA